MNIVAIITPRVEFPGYRARFPFEILHILNYFRLCIGRFVLENKAEYSKCLRIERNMKSSDLSPLM